MTSFELWGRSRPVRRTDSTSSSPTKARQPMMCTVSAWRTGLRRSPARLAALLAVVLAGTCLPVAPAIAQVLSSATGEVLATGSNEFGQLGDPTADSGRLMPGAVSVPRAVQIASGRDHAYALDGDGRVWAWGNNQFGQLGDGTATARSTPVALALDDVVMVEAGHYHGLAVRADGSVWSWGYGGLGQLGHGDTVNRSVPTLVPGLAGVSRVAGGRDTSYAVDGAGTVYAWGNNSFGEVGDGTTQRRTAPVEVVGMPTMADIVGGRNHALAVTTDGQLWSWGDNRYGQLGDGTTVQRAEPVAVGLSDIINVDAGAHHSVAVTGSGAIYTWGRGYRGQLGHGDSASRPSPTVVQGLPSMVQVGDGRDQTYAITADRVVWAWGNNDDGQLGDGTTTRRFSPVELAVERAIAVQGGSSHAVFFLGDPFTEPGPGVLAADPVDFGQVGVGGSATASVSVRNMGGSAVSVTQATVGGPFSVTGGPSLPVSVSPGGSVSFEVAFAPTVVGAVEADLVVAHDGVNDPLTVALSGVGVAVAEPGDGVELVGAVGTNGNLTNYSVVVPQGTAAGDGMVLVLSTAALVDVQSLTGDGRWEPLFEPQDNGQLRLRAWQTVAGADDAGSLLTVGLSSRAKADVSLYVYRGTALDGPVAVAAVQAATSTTSVHATPVVNQPVVGARVLSYWTDRSSSTDGWALPASIEEALYEGAGVGGGRITALAVDQADAVAPYGGLSAQALTGNGMPSASLRAFGATFVLIPQPGTVEPGPGVLAADPVDFGQVGVGGSATASVSVRNMGGSAVSVTQATVGGPFSVTGGPSLPVSVSPGGSVSFEVTFAPTVVGAVEADLVVAHDGVNDPLTVALSGVGVAVAEPGDGVELVGAVGTNGNLTNYSVVVPQGTAAGDGMVLVLSTAALVDVQSLTGDGRWEPLFEPQDNGQLRLRAWQTVAGADDAGSLLTVGLSSRAKADVSLYVYRGTALDGPVAVAAVQAATSTTSVHATPVVNQPVVGARVLSYWTDRSSSTDGWALPASIEEALYEGAGVGGGRITALAVDQADAVAPYGGLSAQALTGNGMPSASLRAFGATFVLTPE
jgi:alpha-tubulin suppressor-like RCC1 family protein